MTIFTIVNAEFAQNRKQTIRLAPMSKSEVGCAFAAPWHQGPALLLAMSREGGVRILLALAVMMLVATPAFAGGHKNKGNLDQKINNLKERIADVVVNGGSVGGTEERRNLLDKLEVNLGYALYQRNQKDDH